jgi:hypothetical protein
MIEVGIIVEGTMRTEDVCSAIMDVLEVELASDQFKQVEYGLKQAKRGGYYESYVWEDLFDAMDDIAPANLYFGNTEGNASDYGFWEIEDEE